MHDDFTLYSSDPVVIKDALYNLNIKRFDPCSSYLRSLYMDSLNRINDLHLSEEEAKDIIVPFYLFYKKMQKELLKQHREVWLNQCIILKHDEPYLKQFFNSAASFAENFAEIYGKDVFDNIILDAKSKYKRLVLDDHIKENNVYVYPDIPKKTKTNRVVAESLIRVDDFKKRAKDFKKNGIKDWSSFKGLKL